MFPDWLAFCICCPLKISSNAPVAPMNTPISFLPVTGSRKYKAAMIIVSIGELVVTIEALIGEVMLSPKIYEPWLKTMPSMEAKNRESISLWLTCSCLVKNETNQNRSAAPNIRQSVKTKGDKSAPERTNFPTGAISPHINSAPNIAACPFTSFVVILIQEKVPPKKDLLL